MNIRVVWSGFGPPGMSMQNLSTFHRSFILVLILAQYSNWVTQWEVYLPACGCCHRNLTLWRWFKEKPSVSVTLGFSVSLVYLHTCLPHDSLGCYLCAPLADREYRSIFTSWRTRSVYLQPLPHTHIFTHTQTRPNADTRVSDTYKSSSTRTHM